MREKYKEMIKKISFEGYCKDYDNYEITPFVTFFKYLAWRPEDLAIAEKELNEGHKKLN